MFKIGSVIAGILLTLYVCGWVVGVQSPFHVEHKVMICSVLFRYGWVGGLQLLTYVLQRIPHKICIGFYWQDNKYCNPADNKYDTHNGCSLGYLYIKNYMGQKQYR